MLESGHILGLLAFGFLSQKTITLERVIFPHTSTEHNKDFISAPIIIGESMMPPSVITQEKAHEEDPRNREDGVK